MTDGVCTWDERSILISPERPTQNDERFLRLNATCRVQADDDNQDSAEVGNTFKYPEHSGKAEAGALAFGEFRVGDHWFVVMDNGSGQDHGFGGVFLLVNCADQEEIDFLWGSLSAEPAAEQCGWLKDKFGMAWQIVPANLEELIQRPDAFAHMMQMKKLVIADF